MRRKLVMLALRYEGIKILLLRRTLPELRENHVVPLLTELGGIAKYRGDEHVFLFPNGSRLRLGYCAAENDVYQYQGQEYDVIGLEEATHFTEAQMQFLTTCNRTVRTDFTPRMYYTCNPGNVGHVWVKRLFIDRQYNNGEDPGDYVFIPARVWDNEVLMTANPEYIKNLESLPDNLRRAFLDGDWDVFEGQYFPEFSRARHVVEPFPIPAHWSKYRAFDYGLDMLACLWAAFDELGNAYIYNELYEPNLVISAAAEKILARDSARCTFAPADMWGRNRDSGKAQADLFAEHGLPLVRVRNPRVDGWLNIKEWLKPTADGARLRIFSNCVNLIRCIPLLQHDDKDPADCSTKPHEITHAPDALRYLMDGRPRPADAPVVDDGRIGYDEQIDSFLDYGR